MRTWIKGQACWAMVALAAGALATLAVGCGSKSGDEAEGGGGPSNVINPNITPPCNAELAGSCGTACGAGAACAPDMFCSAGACTAQCTPSGGQCLTMCLPDGTCYQPVVSDEPVLGGGPAGSAGGPAVVNPNGETCIQQGLEFESLTPTVELLVDRSASMDADFGAQDRWNTIRDILVDPAMGFVKVMEAKVRFGMTLYTGLAADDPGGPSCPNLIDVPIAYNNHQMIHDIFMANETGNNTPTAESLTVVTAKLVAFQEIGPKFIVLATDGDPDTCAEPDSNGTDPPRVMAEAAVQAAWDQGISTYVIAVGDEIADLQHMQNLAVIGRGGDPNAMYYPAMDANSLVGAFQDILGVVVSCDFELNGTVQEGAGPRGQVSLGGVPLVYGTDWELGSSTSIRLLGAACDSIKTSAARIDIQFPCGTVDIIR